MLLHDRPQLREDLFPPVMGLAPAGLLTAAYIQVTW